MLHASETWALTKTNLRRNDRAMIRQICSIKPQNVSDLAKVRSSELLAKLALEDLNLILRDTLSTGWHNEDGRKVNILVC